MKTETMEHQDNKYIAVAYQLYADIDGNRELIEETADGQPFIFISGMGITLPAFEDNLATLDKDSEFDFIIPQAEAYGEYVDERVVDLDKSIFMPDGKLDTKVIYVDATIPLVNEDGNRFMGRILEIGDNKVKVDLNHPLAGLDLHFVGRVVESRPARQDEIERMVKMMSGEGCGGCGGGDCGDCGKESNCSGCGGC